MSEKAIQLPRLGVLRLKERGYLPLDARITSATVSERAARWFVSIHAEEEPVRQKGTETLGVDAGITHLATLSDGTVFDNPRSSKAAEARLRRLGKSVSRKGNGSRNRAKAVARLSRQHYRVSCIREDAIHKTSGAIAKRAAVLGMESLNVAGMRKNRRLAKAVCDSGMAELHRQLRYKMAWAGATVRNAGRWFPSSKMCSRCGMLDEGLTLSDRVFECGCGLRMDRDLKAAINLRKLAASSAVTACGEESSGPRFGVDNTGLDEAGTKCQRLFEIAG